MTAGAVNGVATFGNLVINTAGSYTLAATDGSLTGATSQLVRDLGRDVRLRRLQHRGDRLHLQLHGVQQRRRQQHQPGVGRRRSACRTSRDRRRAAAFSPAAVSPSTTTAVYTPSNVNLADGQVHTLSEYVTAVSGLGTGDKPLQLGYLAPASTGFNAGFSFISARILGNNSVEFQYDNGTLSATSIDNTKPTGTITAGDWLDLILTTQETASGSFTGDVCAGRLRPDRRRRGTTVLARSPTPSRA